MGREKKAVRFPIFRDRLAELQGDRTIEVFAETLGISRATLGFYLAGSRIPDALGVKNIADRCGVSSDYLLGLSDTKSQNGNIRQASEYTGLDESVVIKLHEIYRKSLKNSAKDNVIHDFIYSLLLYDELDDFVKNTYRCALSFANHTKGISAFREELKHVSFSSMSDSEKESYMEQKEQSEQNLDADIDNSLASGNLIQLPPGTAAPLFGTLAEHHLGRILHDCIFVYGSTKYGIANDWE